MAAVPINLLIEKGEDWEVSFNLRDEYGEYLNLSGYTVVAKMSRNYTSSQKYNLNAQIVSPSEGLIKLQMPNSGSNLIMKTQDLNSGRYVYSIFIDSSSGKSEKVIEGIITVNPSVL
jgi:hypothetical protein